MHSGHGGRGEETPEVREGIVLPAQSEPWEALPAGGQPWGQPEQPQAQPQPQQSMPQQSMPQPQASYSPFDGYGQPPAQPLPDGDATQMFPPYPQSPAPVPVPAPGVNAAADSTQMLPPYPQAMPPMAEQTQVLRPVPAAEPAQQPPHFDQYGGYEAQQPSPPQDDFAHLYRQDGAPAQQQPQQFQQPQFQQPQFQQPQAPPWQQQPAQPHEYAPQQPHEAGPGRKKLSPAAVVGIVVACCALAGLAAGAVMSGGGHDTQGSSGSSPSAAASSSASTSSGDAGGAKGQAEKLDALLKQSGSSRASVISAVSGIQACQNLGQAATDLRAAATQRKGLVASLGSLPVDQLPDHQALTEALTNAWNASASADTHYAAWADQAANQNKVCKNGRARSTAQRTAGDQSSVAATAQKKRAVSLWNSIAVQYGLKKYQASEL